MPNRSAHIRRLFLDPKPLYTVSEAVKLLGMRTSELRAWLASGEIEAVDDGIPWSELVSFGMDFWSQEVVEEALGADVAEAIPELLRLTELEVRIPRMEVVTLERLAALDGETVSAVLARELLDLVSTHSEWLSAEVPGFAEALAWPASERIEPPTNGRSGSGSASRAGAGRKAHDGQRMCAAMVHLANDASGMTAAGAVTR